MFDIILLVLFIGYVLINMVTALSFGRDYWILKDKYNKLLDAYKKLGGDDIG